MRLPPLDPPDLDEVLDVVADDVRPLLGGRVLVTGGTGFVGRWMLESLAWCADRLAGKIQLVSLSRDPSVFRRTAPHLDGAVTLTTGDVTRLDLSAGALQGRFDAVIHAASAASRDLNADDPTAMLRTIVDGTAAVLALAERSGRIPVLLASSGAVYGKQPPDLDRISEDFTGAPDCLAPESAHHEGKRVSELLGAIASSQSRVDAKIARMFAFVGPHLPLDRHFAIGNFIGDVIEDRPIEIHGDGTPVRSYQYASDMTAWLLRILLKGETSRAYNVGSEDAVDLSTMASAVAQHGTQGRVPVNVLGRPFPGQLSGRYVPDTSRANHELDLRSVVPLAEGIARTVSWHRKRVA